jgi:hypothetical protein
MQSLRGRCESTAEPSSELGSDEPSAQPGVFVYVEAVSFRAYSGVVDSQSPVGSHRQPQHLLVKFAYMFGLADMHGENICDVGTDADTARSGFMLHNRPYRAG